MFSNRKYQLYTKFNIKINIKVNVKQKINIKVKVEDINNPIELQHYIFITIGPIEERQMLTMQSGHNAFASQDMMKK